MVRPRAGVREEREDEAEPLLDEDCVEGNEHDLADGPNQL
jgi:hypothetical protein